MVEEIFKNTIKEYGLLKKKDSLLLGVSGGPDSIFMLYQFLALREEYKLNLVCLHFNHSLRKEADDEENFVRETAESLKLKFISEKKDVKKFFKGDSLEQTARNLRYDFFLKVSRQTKIKKLALAHHKDDLIETILMRLIRGSGLRGLRGFLPQSRFKQLMVIRPLIQIRKKDIIAGLKKKKVPYCIDKSNWEEKFFRNKIRLKLLPTLKEFNPNISDHLFKLAFHLSLDYDFISAEAYRNFICLKRKEMREGIALDLEGLKKLHPSILNNVLRTTIEELKGDIRRIDAVHLQEIRELILNRPSGSIVHLPALIVRKEEKLVNIQTLGPKLPGQNPS